MSTDHPADPIVKHAKAYHSATGRVSAADRNLTELLHPAFASGLTPEQREKIHAARALVRTILPPLRELAGVNALPPVDKSPEHHNVIPLRPRAYPRISV